MSNHKLDSIVYSLDLSEWKSLGKYLTMETTSKDIHLLYDTMRSHRQAHENDRSDATTRALSHLSTKGLLNLKSQLYKIVEGWMVWTEMQKDEMMQTVLLIKQFNRRGLSDLADKCYRKTIRMATNNDPEDLFVFEKQMQAVHYHYFSENPIKDRHSPELLNRMTTQFLLSIKERCHLYLSELENRKMLYDDDLTQLADQMKTILSAISVDSPTTLIRDVHDLITVGTPESLEPLLKKLQNNKAKPESDLQVFATLYGIATALRLWRTGHAVPTKTIAEFYEYGLTSGVLMNLGSIATRRFLNMVSVWIKTQPTAYCLKMIDQWCHTLSDENPQSARALAISYVCIKTEDYHELIPLLRPHKFINLSNQVRADSHMLMGIYKEGNYELLYHQTHNFRRRIKGYRKALEVDDIRSYVNFSKVLDLLARRQFTDAHIDLQKLKVMANRIWIEKELKSEGIM